ncbi:LptF/LptG family permease [Alistipes sp. OttesenSCG-928-B03]|nr:LptF/LptG family permease [Alistipes sp. OttesenSCG-928-B03]
MKINNPGFKILDRYITRKFLGTYFFAIALIIVIVVIFDAVEKIDDFVEMHAPLSEIVFGYYLNFIPYFINQFSGLFTFIAVIFFTSKLAYQTEIIAMLSGGMSFNRLMWPYFLSASAITILSLALSLFIIPPANERRLDFEMKYMKKNRNLRADRNIYRQVSPGTFAYIRDYNMSEHTASFIALEQYEDNKVVGILEAGSAKLDPETRRWTASRYTTRQLDGETEVFEQHQKLDTLINIDANEFGRVDKVVEGMSIGRLNRFIKQQKDKGSNMISIFEVERAQRFSYPFSTFILTLIGVSLSSRKVRGGTGLHIGIGITLCFTYILFAKFAQEFAKGGVLPAVISVWIPNVIYALIAIYLYKKAPK